MFEISAFFFTKLCINKTLNSDYNLHIFLNHLFSIKNQGFADASIIEKIVEWGWKHSSSAYLRLLFCIE